VTNSPSSLIEPDDGIKIYNEEQLDMENDNIPKRKNKKDKKKENNDMKNTLSVYTYLNFKRFGVALSIDDGIKITILWFETHIKFEKR